jgi:hypothetical protein
VRRDGEDAMLRARDCSNREDEESYERKESAHFTHGRLETNPEPELKFPLLEP